MMQPIVLLIQLLTADAQNPRTEDASVALDTTPPKLTSINALNPERILRGGGGGTGGRGGGSGSGSVNRDGQASAAGVDLSFCDKNKDYATNCFSDYRISQGCPLICSQKAGRTTLTALFLDEDWWCHGFAQPKAANGDLNEGAGGKYIYLCQATDGVDAHISNLYLTGGDNKGDCPLGNKTLVKDLNGDLNQGADGKYIYLCQESGGSRQVNNVYLTDKRDNCPYGSTLVTKKDEKLSLNGDLNQGTGGKQIYLCQSFRGFPHKYSSTFQKTGCPNSSTWEVSDWRKYDGKKVWKEMFDLCDRTKKGSATKKERQTCCGAGETCTPEKCELQTSWSDRAYVACDGKSSESEIACKNAASRLGKIFKTTESSAAPLGCYKYKEEKCGSGEACAGWVENVYYNKFSGKSEQNEKQETVPGYCPTECASNAQCETGEHCYQGFCIAPSGTCANRCAANYRNDDECQCDALCKQAGDCCSDFEQVCNDA